MAGRPIPGPSLPAEVQAFFFARDPIGVLLRCRGRFGPVFTLRLAGAGSVVIVSDPSSVGELLGADPTSLHAGAARRNLLPQASPRSSFGADGQEHEKARQRIVPPLAAERIMRMEDVIAATAERHVARWPTGRPAPVLSRMRSLAEEIFVRVGLGVRDDERARAIAARVGKLLRTPGNPPLLPPDADEGLSGRLLHRIYSRRLAPLVALLSEVIEARRSSPEEDGILGHILTVDPELPTRAIVDQLIVVLAAAQEPPSIALTWVLATLSRDPPLAERYLAESDDGPERKAIVDETLRLRPPALALLRRLAAERTIHGLPLEKGTDVMVPIPLVHRDPAVFPNPLIFDPNRFAAPERPEFFIPFGSANRRCPGEALARLELRTVIPLVLQRLRLRFLYTRERPVQRATVLVPNRSGLAVANRRG